MYSCNICRKNINEIYIQWPNSIESDTIDICRDCIESEKKFNIFHVVGELVDSAQHKCFFCAELIRDKHNIINVDLFVCGNCIDTSSSLERVNSEFNERIRERIMISCLNK